LPKCGLDFRASDAFRQPADQLGKVSVAEPEALWSDVAQVLNQLCSAVEVLVGVVTSGEGTRAG
jgi:predicted lysophospholipase L1 biosynthesis ABC-type transport system permease subunit